MCCLFGLIDYKGCLTTRQKERIIKILSTECEARGTDATGIAYIKHGKMNIYKRPLPAHKMRYHFKTNPQIIMGHTRLTTQGSERMNYNNHPFLSEKMGFALAHNGVLFNDSMLRKSQGLPETKIETDSYIAVQLIEKEGLLNFSAIAKMAETVHGSFCFTILSPENELYIVKGDNPMAIAKFNGFYVYASTAEVLKKALIKLGLEPFEDVKIEEGDILKFNRYGSITKSSFEFTIKYYDYYRYGKFKRYKSNITSSTKQDSKTGNSYDGYLECLIQYANSIGYGEDTISELLEAGYDYLDIEEMLYDAEMMAEYYYGESEMYLEEM